MEEAGEVANWTKRLWGVALLAVVVVLLADLIGVLTSIEIYN